MSKRLLLLVSATFVAVLCATVSVSRAAHAPARAIPLPEASPAPVLPPGSLEDCGYCTCTDGPFATEVLGQSYVSVNATCEYDGECIENAEGDCVQMDAYSGCYVVHPYSWDVPVGSECKLIITNYWRSPSGQPTSATWNQPLQGVSGSGSYTGAFDCGDSFSVEIECILDDMTVIDASVNSRCSNCP